MSGRAGGEVDAAGARAQSRSIPWLERVAWAVVVLIAIAAPLAVSARAFPNGSPDRDDVAYLSQADALRHGHLTLAASTHQPFFRPFLSGVQDGRVVFKYQPVWPAMIAASEAVTGTPRTALALAGLAATLAVAALAFEVARRRTAALVAAALFACSPWFVVQSGTYLAYPLSAALAAGATALVLRGVRLGRRLPMVCAGAAFGLAAFHRPYDAVLAGIPVFVWLLVRRGRDRVLWRDLALIAAGAAPFVLAMLAYNAAVTGHPLRFAFSTSGPLDRFGFGKRSSFASVGGRVPGQPELFDFTPGEALRTVGAFAASLVDWLPGGLLVAVPVVIGLRRARDRSAAWLVGAQALAFPIGYLVWWGAANARSYDLHLFLGPIYWFPLLAATAVLAGAGIDHLAAEPPAPLRRLSGPALAGGAVALLVLASLVTSGDTRRDLRAAVRSQDDEVASLQAPTDRRSLVIAPRHYPGDRYVPVAVPVRLGGEHHLVGLDPTGGWRTFDLLDRSGDRAAYRVIEVHQTGKPFDDGIRRPERLVVRSGPTVELRVAVLGYRPTATVAGRPVPVEVQGGQIRLVLAARPGPGQVVVPGGGPHQVEIGIDGASLRWLVRVDPKDPTQVQVLEPPTPIRHYEFPGHRPAEVIEDVSPVIHPA